MRQPWDAQAEAAFDGLLHKYTELLIGTDDAESIEMIKKWALFNHIHKTMPNLVRHWHDTHPEGKAAMREIFEEVKSLNEAHRQSGSSNPSE